MLTVRSGSLFRVTVTSTVPPSATLYVDCSKLTVTCGSSSSVIVPVAASVAAPPARRRVRRPAQRQREGLPFQPRRHYRPITGTEMVWLALDSTGKVRVPFVEL